ncbi:hypothetical protein H7K45_01810 [Mycobacterium yunnanensis]|uniref:Uncharacterized protein n=1 Tax=Mycobacterium yunnanensis TaxID=368477 RepID=A0A9X2YWS3_9MYCO|nr:hypothetical protein [Mycobacterium yunnanensis]MCV7419265.1 hypothetical protein [Mycobacterium yunnanensis]
MTSDGPPSEETRIIRRQPEAGAPPTSNFAEQQTGIIRRHPTGAFPATPEPQTSFIPQAVPVPSVAPPQAPRQQASRRSPLAASATATVSIISGWATAVIATSLISGWWGTDELFCIAIGFLTAVSAAATIGGLISLLLRQRIGRLLIVVGSIVALMIFAGLFVAGADLPRLVYGIPILPVAAITLALLPATGRWCD